MGTGVEVSIRELAELIIDVVNPTLEIAWDAGKPDGTPRKLLDVLATDGTCWAASTSLRSGVERTYEWLLANQANARGMTQTHDSPENRQKV